MKANGTNNGCSRLNTPLAATTTLEDPGTPASWKGPPAGSEASPFTPNSVGGGPGSGGYNTPGGGTNSGGFQGPSPFPGGAGSPASGPGYQGPPPGSGTPQYTASPAPSGSSTPGPGPPSNPGGFPPPPNNSGPYNGPGPSPFGSPSGPPQFVGRPGSSGPPFVPPGGNPHFSSPGQFPGPQYGMPPGSPFGPGGHPMGGPMGPGHPMMGPSGPVDRMDQGTTSKRTSTRLQQQATLSCKGENNYNDQCSPSSSESDNSFEFDDDDRDPTFELFYSHQADHTASSCSDSDVDIEVEEGEIENIKDSSVQKKLPQDLTPNVIENDKAEYVQEYTQSLHLESDTYMERQREISGNIKNFNKENEVQQGLVQMETQDNNVSNINKTNKFDLAQYIANRRPKKKRTTCKFCNLDVTNFERHLERKHQNNKEVREMMSYPKKSSKRKTIIQLLRNAGHFNEYLRGNVKPVYQKKNEPDFEYSPCAYCKGLFKKKFLYRHYKKCPAAQIHKNFGNVKHFAASQTLVACALDTNNCLDTLRVKNEVFNRMRADEISMVAKTDILIYRYGERYLKKHKRKQMITSCSNKMRELARLLIALRKIENNTNLKMIDAIEPSMFTKVVECAKQLGGFDSTTKIFKNSPSLSAHLGTTLQGVCDELTYLIETKNQCLSLTDPDAKSDSVKRFKNLISTQWTTEISSLALKDLNEKKWVKPVILPLTKDVLEFKNYVNKVANVSAANLTANPNSPNDYKDLVSATLVLTILYNRRRIGDVQYTKLNTYLSDFTSINQEECLNSLTESEKALTKFYKRIVTGGKGSRAVVILFPQNLQNLMNVLIDVRMKTTFVPIENEYLFAQIGTNSWIRGDKVIQKFAQKCNLQHPEHITSNKLRKQIATVMQVLNLNQEETEQFAEFMGHTKKTHDEFYKLPQDVYQTAKVSKLLMLMDRGEGDKFKGKSLGEIDITPETDVANEEESEDETLPLPNPEIAIDKIMNFSEPSTSKNTNNEIKPKSQTGRSTWTAEEIEIVKNHFKNHIKQKQPPKKAECEELINKYPNLLKSKGWVRIKTYVYNAYRLK